MTSPSSARSLYSLYPDANAIYDCGKYYGINVQESFYLVDKNTLETVETLPRYDSKCLEIIEKAIPIHYANDDNQ